jgi:hypothetical protein
MEDPSIWDVFLTLKPAEPPEKIKHEFICSYCNVSKILTNDLPVCPECGRVDSCFLSDEPEWVGGGDDDGYDPSRCGMPVDNILFSERWGIGTSIVG